MCRHAAPFCMTVLAVLIGCNAPADTKVLEPFIAAAGQYSVMASSSPPPPQVVGGVCEACFGRGFVGDGVVKTKCLRCDGTGKKKATATPNCKDGSCQIPKSTVR